MQPSESISACACNSHKPAFREQASVTLRQLSELSLVTEVDLIELTRYGVLEPIDPEQAPPSFRPECVTVSRRAGRLRTELALDEHAFALAVMFFHKLVGLEDDVSALRFALRKRELVVPMD